MVSPFTVTVFDKSMAKRGTVGAVQSLTASPRHNQQSTAQIVVPGTSPRLADLMAEGARVVIGYRGSFLMSGPVQSYVGQGPRDASTFTFQVVDDWELLARMLAWPVPGSAIGSQTAAEYDVRTGAAETVFKSTVTANKGHGNAAVTVATDLGRGTSITVAERFHALTERLIPLVDGAGIGTTVQQNSSGVLVVDCYPTRAYPRTLSEASGIVQDWSYAHTRAKATRAIVGGQGVGTARAFRAVTDTAGEAALGYTVEAFVDSTSSVTSADLDLNGAQFLTANGATNGLSVVLSETPSFRYDPTGVNGVRVGDVIHFSVGPGVVITDVLRSCTIVWSADNGLSVHPEVGLRSDDPSTALANIIAGLRRSISNQRR